MRGLAYLPLMCALFAGCSDKHSEGDAGSGHTSPYPSCNAITQACHAFDVGPGPIHDCHDFGHAKDASEAKCAAKKAECLAICVADAGAGDAGRD